MISTKDAYRDDEDTELTPAGDVSAATEKPETEPKKEETTVPESKEEVKDDTGASPKTEPADNKKPEYTPQEKINFSFSKMKKKHREETERLNARIKELEKQVADFQGKTRESFDSDEEYLDARLDARDAQRELMQTRQQSLTLAEQQQAEIMRERVTKLYPTEGLQKVYADACKIGQQNGALEAIMGDKVVKEYLFGNGKDTGSDKGPLLIEAFCKQPKLLERILETSDNRKGFAMYDLEQRLAKIVEDAERKARQQTQQPASPQAPTQTPATTAIPVVGKVANAGVNKSAPSDDWEDEKALFKFARS